MLMTSYLMIIFMLLLYKTKSSWETKIITLSMMSMHMMLLGQPTSMTYLPSMYLMLDSMSLTMIILSTWITSLMLMASMNMKKTKNIIQFETTTLLLLLNLLMCFSTNNIIMFYILFETSLIPTLLLIMLWGYNMERLKASFYIMMYTISASLPLLMIILKLTMTSFHMSMYLNFMYPLSMMKPQMSWMMMVMAFMIKLPMFTTHLWLPKAHAEAPIAGSMILAGILLKLGAYGLMRMNMMLNQPMFSISYMITSLSITGAIITNIICIRQTDMKILIAYSSIGHMSLLVIGIMSNSKLGQFGSLIIMLTHGLSSSCMFFLSNNIYESLNTRNMLLINVSPMIMPLMSLSWMLVILTNMALPPSLNIMGEIIIMMSSFFIAKPMIAMLMIMSLSTSLYSLYLYSMICHGNKQTLINLNQQMSSMNMTTLMVHLWPLFILIMLPMKLMSWC